VAETIDWVSSTAVMRYYGNETYKITQIPFNFDLIFMNEYPTPKIFDRLITKWMKEMPPGAVANWLVINS